MPEGFFGVFQPPDPEEQRRQQEERMIQAHVAHQEITEFLTGLETQQVKTLLRLLESMLGSNGEKNLLHWRGYLHSIMEQQHNVCACGEDHADDLLRSLSREGEQE